MKLKQYLPLLAILLFSFLSAIGATSYLFISSKYPEDVTAKLMLSLRQGVVLSLVLFVLLLIGLGINSLLARIQDSSRRKLFSLIVYIGSFALCVALPAIAIVSTYFLFSQQKGWQKLPAVTSPAAKVIALGKDSVVVQSNDDNYYYCWIAQLDQCWKTVDKPAKLLLENYEGEIKSTDNPPSVTPPNDVIDLVGVSYNNSAIFLEAHYAVTSDGNVWYLNHETNNGTAGFATGFMFIFALPVMLGAIAILLGAGISGITRKFANHN